jgi:hypothetical protein
MKLAFCLATSLSCLSFLNGCIIAAYAYPRFDYTPGVKPGAQRDDVYAFRVD